MLTERLRGHGKWRGDCLQQSARPARRLGGAGAVCQRTQFANYDFAVQENREYTRRIGGQVFPFTDYVLRGISTSRSPRRTRWWSGFAWCRTRPGAHDSLLLRVEDEFAFAEDFLNVVKDDSASLT